MLTSTMSENKVLFCIFIGTLYGIAVVLLLLFYAFVIDGHEARTLKM